MKNINICPVALVGALLLGTSAAVIPTTPAVAQGFFDQLFGAGPSFRDPVWDRRNRERLRRRDREELRRPVRAARIRVSSPKYYQYKADKLTSASFEKLAQVQLASVDETNVPTTPFAQAAEHLSGFRLRLLPEVSETILSHYAETPAFIWITDGAVNERAESVLAVLGRADTYGLETDDYAVERPILSGETTSAAGTHGDVTADDTEDGGPGDALADVEAILADANSDADEAALIRFEITLSARMLTYALDAERGRIDPNRISGYHDIPRRDVDLATAMRFAESRSDFSVWLERRNPINRKFTALKAKLAELRATVEVEKPIEIATGTFLKPGATSPEVANVVAAIDKIGSPALKAEHAETLSAYAGDEEYTPELVALVTAFQRESDLAADGIVGPNTIGALVEDSRDTRIEKVILGMERLRWLPRHLGARNVFVNQPAYTATYTELGQEPLSMRAVVGQKANQTSFFIDEIERVEYNPYWGVPYSIIVNEMIPELYKDRSYLDRLGYEVTTQSGRRVSSTAVNWYGVSTKAVSINVRQPPGPKNALGELKILFPNKHHIYMHDTPAKSLFDKDRRAFSHGCIRLHDPRGMAAAVLGVSREYIGQRIAEGVNQADPVERKIPVYVAYFTAWPTPDGDVLFYDDVYERDVYLTRAIERTREVRSAG